MKELIISKLRESADLKIQFAKESMDGVINAVDMLKKSFKTNGKLLIFGNGGSAADSQHIASEFVNRFYVNRNALPAIALTTDTSIITSISNDFNFNRIFSRQIEALGNKNDIAWGISTSGKSQNVINAFKTAKSMGLKTICFSGQDGLKTKQKVDCLLKVPSKSTPRIQEVHLTIAHIICELVEEGLSEKD